MDVRQLPKVELHRHVEATVRRNTAREMAARNGGPEPPWSKWHHYTDIADFLEFFMQVAAVPALADDYRRLAYESAQDASAAGVVHTEMFFSPSTFLGRGVTFDAVWSGLSAGAAQAESDLGISVRFICNIDKERGPGPALEVVEMCRDRGPFLVGVGGDGWPATGGDGALRPAFDQAARYGLRRTAHADEESPQGQGAEGVVEIIRGLGCERIDHGTKILLDPGLTAFAAEHGVGFTICPFTDVALSHLYPSLEEHPLPRLLSAGLRVTLASDCPGLMEQDLADVYAAVLDRGLVDAGQLRRVALNGVDACWLEEEKKAHLNAGMAAAWGAWHTA